MADETGKSAAQLKAEEELKELNLQIARRQAKIQEIALETAELDLEEAKDRNARLKADKADKSRKNKQRQGQLHIDRSNRRQLRDHTCSHRQGGSPRNQYKGKGDSALSVFNMPDGFTQLVKCIICRGEWWSPHPADQAQKPRDGETAGECRARVAQYRDDYEEFQRVLALAMDKLTEEAAQPMECGVTITTTNLETGAQTLRRRPCDSYAGV